MTKEKGSEKQEKKSAYDTFQEAYEKNPRIVKKFIRWKIIILVILLTIAFLVNRYVLTPYFQSRFS